MVLDFLKRKKRLSGALLVPSIEVPGLYTRRGEWGSGRAEWGPREPEQGGRGEESRLSPPDLTWDTLKRLRRASSQARRGQFGSVQSLAVTELPPSSPVVEGKVGEQYQSSPTLWHPTIEYTSLTQTNQNIQAESVLKYTAWDCHSSLITLDLLGTATNQPVPSTLVCSPWHPRHDGNNLDRRKEKENEDQEEKDKYSLIPSLSTSLDVCQEEREDENDDSGLFYDSDSGISSLYESVGKIQTQIQKSENDRDTVKERRSIEEDTNGRHCHDDEERKNEEMEQSQSVRVLELLHTWRVDPRLWHLFLARVYKWSEIQAQSPSCQILSFTQLIPSDVTCPKELQKVMREILTQKQHLLNLKLLELQLKLSDVDEFLSYVEVQLLRKEESESSSRYFREFIRQTDSMTCLMTGLQHRLKEVEERLSGAQDYSARSRVYPFYRDHVEDFSLKRSLVTLTEQLQEAEYWREKIDRKLILMENLVDKHFFVQESRLEGLNHALETRRNILEEVGLLRRDLHRTKLQTDILNF